LTEVGRQGRQTSSGGRSTNGRLEWVVPVLVVVAAVVAALGTLVATSRYGIGLTPDSVVYLDGARRLAGGDGYVDAGFNAITSFPPGYSAALSLADRLGLEAQEAARWLGVVTFPCTVLLAYVLVRRHVESRDIRAGATILIGASAVLLEVQTKALSEHLFLIVVLGFLLVLEELQVRPAHLGLLAGAVALSWAAFYLRYAGIALLPTGAIVLVAATWSTDRRRGILRAAVFCAAGLAVPALLMLRNADRGAGPLGPRAESSASPAENVRRVANEVSQWLATDSTPAVIRAVAVVAVVALVAGCIVAARRGHIDLSSTWRSVVPLLTFVTVYVVYLVASASVVAFAAIHTRFMVPVFVPIVVLGAWLLDRTLPHVDRAALRTAIVVIALVWVAGNVVWFAGRAARMADEGAGGYATERWHESRLIEDVKRLDFAVPTYSNDSAAIRMFAGEEVEQSVARTRFQSDQRTGRLPAFVREVECEGRAQLVWFLPNARPYLYTPSQLAQVLSVEPVVERGDGVIYDLAPKDAAADCEGE
jgi:hypothetical protein